MLSAVVETMKIGMETLKTGMKNFVWMWGYWLMVIWYSFIEKLGLNAGVHIIMISFNSDE